MIQFDEAAGILDGLVEELPEGIFEKLNGGVNLIEEAKHGENGDYIMGLYHVDGMGRYIEIFYGSFVELYGDIDSERLTSELRKTLHHELTHHVESMAGDRTLEKWDEVQAERRRYGSVEANSILFIDDDGAALAPMACAMFKKYSGGRCAEVKSAAACIDGFGGAYNPDAAAASEEQGAPITAGEDPFVVKDVAMRDYDVMLCMTMSQSNELFERFPEFDERIMCLGGTDIKPPLFKRGWAKTAKRMRGEIESLIDELCGEED